MKGLGGQQAPLVGAHLLELLDRFEDGRVILGIAKGHHALEVPRGGAQDRDRVGVDEFEDLGHGDLGFLQDLRERIEVDDHEIDRIVRPREKASERLRVAGLRSSEISSSDCSSRLAVPPEATIDQPSSWSLKAKSTTPVLSETLNRPSLVSSCGRYILPKLKHNPTIPPAPASNP